MAFGPWTQATCLDLEGDALLRTCSLGLTARSRRSRTNPRRFRSYLKNKMAMAASMIVDANSDAQPIAASFAFAMFYDRKTEEEAPVMGTAIFIR